MTPASDRPAASALTYAQVDGLQAVEQLAACAEYVGLLRGAFASGLIERCREPARPTDLAAALGLDVAVLLTVCAALVDLGVLDQLEDGRVMVSAICGPLLETGLDQRVLDRLGAVRAQAEIMERLFDARTETAYWDVDPDARVALARAATADPKTAFGREGPVAIVRSVPAWEQAFRRGGRHLDLGCGVAGQSVSYLLAYPELRIVAVDRSGDLLDVARTRAEVAGVIDRVTFVNADAGSFRDPTPFDTAFWPQHYFAEDGRAAALGTLHRCLAPGGLLVTVLGQPDSGSRSPGSEGLNLGAGDLLRPVLRAVSDIPERTLEELAAELEAAGFVDVVQGPAPPLITPQVTARRPS